MGFEISWQVVGGYGMLIAPAQIGKLFCGLKLLGVKAYECK